MSAEIRPLFEIVAGGRSWRVGELGAGQLEQLQPDLRIIASRRGELWGVDECEAFFRIMRELLLAHAPDLRIIDLRVMVRPEHILPVLNEVARQASGVAEKTRQAAIAGLATAAPAGNA